MHAISHTLTHRAPPASRTRARWQPYSSLPPYTTTLSISSSSVTKSSSPASNPTPATSLISPCQPTPAWDNTSNRSALQNPALTASDSLRDANTSKNKFALGLVDQAVKTLCEVWRPQDIPPVFNSPRSTKPAASLPNIPLKSRFLEPTSLHCLATHKSHPTAALTASSSIPTIQSNASATAPPALVQSGTAPELRHLVPIRGFVHEVLRRSRTSGCVLQTALCYLEAIRPKIPELARLEQIGKGTNGEPESAPRVIVATEEEIERSKREEAEELAFGEGPLTVRFSSEDEQDIDCMDTVRVEADEENCPFPSDEPSMNQQQGSSQSSMTMDSTSHIEETVPHSTRASTFSSPSPSANLPSPLLCPRRAFLAALILASKFTQDKCYSNRAWAKLSGLPPREIGRCERALGSTLEWRLWVGKTSCATTPSVPPTSPPANRAVMRCQTESTLNMTISKSSEPIDCVSIVNSESSAFMPETAVIASATLSVPGYNPGNRRMIKRASTLPDGALSRHNKTPRHANPKLVSPTHRNSVTQSWESASSTLVAPSSSFLPTVQLHTASPVPLSSGISNTNTSLSPDMPGLSYSPSSVSSSPSSLCSSVAGDPAPQMSVYFEDLSNSMEFYDSPVARINTKLLVPGYTSNTGSLHKTNVSGLSRFSPSKNPVPLSNGLEYLTAPLQVAAYGTHPICPQVFGDCVHLSLYQHGQ